MTNHTIEPHPVLVRVAKAIAARHIQFGAEDAVGKVMLEHSWRNHLDDARAALEALRDLPEDVIEAGVDALEGVQCAMLDRARSDKPEDMPDYDGGDMAAQPFTAMINTIIGESA